MINTDNLKASLRDLEEIRDTASAAILPLRQLLEKLTNAGGSGVVSTQNMAVAPRSAQNSGSSHEKDHVDDDLSNQDQPQYFEEALAWIHGRGEDRFTLIGFQSYMETKHGRDKVNKHSIRNPFRRLLEKGAIVVIKEGSGRKPAIYSATPLFAAVYEDSIEPEFQ